ncbi:MAG: hypothetical protein ABIR66_03935 [Saprospiraceae bacterium]
MFEEFQICPYTGLRSFTEEESLYFKGREEHIGQATLQLQHNKFLMLTGASGDGKSSLVYAGIVPNARAGFLKAKYTQWHVADFRPERSPFKNLCKSLTRQLDIANSGIVESELQHGFSALVDLYKNSDCYLDTNSTVWNQSDETQKASLKRKAANLMIIVDQFEEFFTNPENYHEGVPSRDSNLVLNLLLETARIALEENLPIYIVFTMRSDYIGQCAAFRSLPEYLGFSQFFVPRLNRLQLQQVIEEPATLSGNRISRRLTERLIHDIAEGVDQLPILQHALNQIWHEADKGREEMDLIHYAMVSGMPPAELPDEDIDRFDTWFALLPEEIKKCYHRPDLQNVLDTHANKLYESAEEEFLEKTGKFISDDDSKLIIKMTFSCLTKIDQSRAVRNRMTLQEIQHILNNESMDVSTINNVLNVFREPGNTFIRPFITDDPESTSLGPENVLDITHESLIRNWDLLKTWAKEEYDSYLISQDFEQQLGRWVESGKSDNYLLSIGPLTYFENWYNNIKPNTWWIARYLPEEDNEGNKIAKAEIIQNNSNEFLRRSAKKHLITRTVMKLGPKRIAAVLAVLVILVLSSFGISNYIKRQNESVLKSIKKETLEFANDSKLGLEYIVPVIIQEIELGNLTIPEVISAVKDPVQKVRLTIGIADLLVAQGWYHPEFEIYQSLSIADNLLDMHDIPKVPQVLSDHLKSANNLRIVLGFAGLYNPSLKIETIARHNALRSGQWVKYILQNKPETFTDIQNLTLALENTLNYKGYTHEELIQILDILSPIEQSKFSPWVNKNFQGDKLLVRGSQDYAFKSNGLFQELAYLYAAAGDPVHALQCIDSLLFYNQNYYQNDYESMIDNASNVIGVFYTYGHLDALEQFIAGYCMRKNIAEPEFYNRTIARIIPDYATTDNYNFYSVTGVTFSNLNLKFCPDDLVDYLFKRMRKSIDGISDQDERNFSLAMAYKNEGTLRSYRRDIKENVGRDAAVDSLFYHSIEYFKLVSATYLSRNRSYVISSSADVGEVPLKYFYLYPDYFVPFHPAEPRRYLYRSLSFAFIEFIIDHHLLPELYKEKEDFKPLEFWLMNYHATSISRDYFLREAIPFNAFAKLANELENTTERDVVDMNLMYLYLGNGAFQLHLFDTAKEYYDHIRPEKVLNAFRFKGLGFLNTYSMEQYGIAISNLYSQEENAKGQILINVFKNKVNRSSLYAFASQKMLLNGMDKNHAQQLIDSAKAEMKRIDNPAVFQPNRHQIANAMMLLDPQKYEPEAQKIIKNAISKFDALIRFSFSHALKGNLYKAYLEIPDNVSDADRTFFLYQLLLGHTKALPQKDAWKKFEQNVVFANRYYLPYINEND